ncbi:heme-binding protein [Methylobacterium nigriterrae]|uniref:heme-binding protein n=1 Tax=Methylobacterium nigriterrae TaxID=3127512 RepID=UPI003013EE0F
MAKILTKTLVIGLSTVAALSVNVSAHADDLDNDKDLRLGCPVTYAQLKSAVTQAAQADTTGLDNDYWAVVVNRSGNVCAVAYSGPTIDSQWLASRQIAAAKAFTANGLSLNLPKGPLSTAQLYGFVQPSPSGGNPLYGLQFGNEQNAKRAYQGDYNAFGTERDPLVGARIGGTITFGGGLALYNGSNVVGGLGLSGDTACADHSTAWRTRTILGMVGPGTDTIPLTNGATPTTGGHPRCPNDTGTQGQATSS